MGIVKLSTLIIKIFRNVFSTKHSLLMQNQVEIISTLVIFLVHFYIPFHVVRFRSMIFSHGGNIGIETREYQRKEKP